MPTNPGGWLIALSAQASESTSRSWGFTGLGFSWLIASSNTDQTEAEKDALEQVRAQVKSRSDRFPIESSALRIDSATPRP